MHIEKLYPPLREAIHEQAQRLGCLESISNLTDVNAIRWLQQKEGFEPCFGRENPLRFIREQWGETRTSGPCGVNNCFWIEACENYRKKLIAPMDKGLPDVSKNELDLFVKRLLEVNQAKTPASLTAGEVGLRIRSFRNIPSATRKMLVATPRTVIAENKDNKQALKAFVLSHSYGIAGWSYPSVIFNHELQVLYTTDLSALKNWLFETEMFHTSGSLSYYPLVQHIRTTRNIMPKASSIPYKKYTIPPIELQYALELEETFSAPHIGFPDGDIMLSDKDFAPILNINLPVLEGIDYGTLFKLMSDFPEELCSFRDFLQLKVEEMRVAAVGSEQFGRECRRIEREIRKHLKKIDSDYKKATLTAAFSLTGCAIAGWTLALYCLVQGEGNILSILGPGGIAYTASAAYSAYLVKCLDIKDDPVQFLWRIGESRSRA